jgi:endonuclease/exonuclease/phosphatase family metal-dependent hydrolase
MRLVFPATATAGRALTVMVRLLLAAFCALAAASAPALAQDAPLRVMAFNVRLPIASDGPNAWEHRRDLLVRTIADARPDIIGTQELFKLQGDYVVERLPQYTWFGIDRRGGHGDEHMGVFYRRDRLRVVESGNFWLSDTPTVPGSITWGHPLPRMVTWALMETIDGGRRFYFYNTHFPYREEDGDARRKGAELIRTRIAALPADVPVILVGDFNTDPDGDVHAALARNLVDVRAAAPVKQGPDATFHNFTGKPDRRIDWIMARGIKPNSTSTLTTHDGTAYPSDHFPVIAEFGWNPSK